MKHCGKIFFMILLLTMTAVSASAMIVSVKNPDNNKNYCLRIMPHNIDYEGYAIYQVHNFGDATCINLTLDTRWHGDTRQRRVDVTSKVYIEHVAPNEIKYFKTHEPIFKKYYWSFPYLYREFDPRPLISHRPMIGDYMVTLTCGDSWARYMVAVNPASVFCGSG